MYPSHYLEDHPMTCKCLETRGIIKTPRLGVVGPLPYMAGTLWAPNYLQVLEAHPPTA